MAKDTLPQPLPIGIFKIDYPKKKEEEGEEEEDKGEEKQKKIKNKG